MSWFYNDKKIKELPKDCVGFVYQITNTTNGRMYIGKKLARFKKSRRPLKGRVNNVLEDMIKSWKVKPNETIVYACGHPGMIEDVKEKLKNSDFTFLEERFWKD